MVWRCQVNWQYMRAMAWVPDIQSRSLASPCPRWLACIVFRLQHHRQHWHWDQQKHHDHQNPTGALYVNVQPWSSWWEIINITQVSVLHQACCARPQARPVWPEIVSCCLNLGAPVGARSWSWCWAIVSAITITMVTQHIPTMTKSHHGGEMSVMIKVGMCQCQIPTIHHDEL